MNIDSDTHDQAFYLSYFKTLMGDHKNMTKELMLIESQPDFAHRPKRCYLAPGITLYILHPARNKKGFKYSIYWIDHDDQCVLTATSESENPMLESTRSAYQYVFEHFNKSGRWTVSDGTGVGQ